MRTRKEGGDEPLHHDKGRRVIAEGGEDGGQSWVSLVGETESTALDEGRAGVVRSDPRAAIREL
eukprot:1255535-Pleurochrysis_carterae.AAC.1